MTFLTDLWLPIVVSAVAVFILSSVIHMMLPIHKNDYRKLPDEDGLMDAIRNAGVQAGEYMFPCAENMKDYQTPEMQEKFKRGPVGTMVVLTPAGFNMGKSLALWFVFTIVIGVLVAYISWHALPAGAEFASVFRIACTTAFLGYAVGHMHNSTWKGVSWMTTLKFMGGGLVYAIATAALFAVFWPSAAA